MIWGVFPNFWKHPNLKAVFSTSRSDCHTCFAFCSNSSPIIDLVSLLCFCGTGFVHVHCILCVYTYTYIYYIYSTHQYFYYIIKNDIVSAILGTFFRGDHAATWSKIYGPCSSPSPSESESHQKRHTGWWFQPIWKILVKLEIFPK